MPRLTVTVDGTTVIDRDVNEIDSEEHAAGVFTLTAMFNPIPLDCSALTGEKLAWP